MKGRKNVRKKKGGNNVVNKLINKGEKKAETDICKKNGALFLPTQFLTTLAPLRYTARRYTLYPTSDIFMKTRKSY